MGANGIHLGPDPAGAPFLDFQRRLYRLSQKGIILAVASKNNYEDAAAVIDRHPYMVLRDAIVAMKINWEPKHRNIERIARELSIGLDSLIFLDDSPFEREMVRVHLPMVLVPDLPPDPRQYTQFLETLVEACPGLGVQPARVTAEAMKRTESYKIRVRRNTLTRRSSVDAMNAQLHTRVVLEPAHAGAIPRVAELCRRTNQFNLTTRRYDEEDLRRFLGDGRHAVFAVKVTDDYEDFGIVGVVVVAREAHAWHLDTLLLSCRVLSRNIETAILSAILDLARAEGVERLVGEFIPTERNRALAASFYPNHHFRLAGKLDDGGTRWEYPSSCPCLQAPVGIIIESSNDFSRSQEPLCV